VTSERLDFRGQRLDDADFSDGRLHGPNLQGTKITDGWLRGADISGFIGGLRVNGVEVAPLVEAELNRRYPERLKLRARDPAGLAEAWMMIEDVWRATAARTRALPEPLCLSGSTVSGASSKRCVTPSSLPTPGSCAWSVGSRDHTIPGDWQDSS
jgi:uncharacterized protein YjbI with pentapeptide repeats